MIVRCGARRCDHHHHHRHFQGRDRAHDINRCHIILTINYLLLQYTNRLVKAMTIFVFNHHFCVCRNTRLMNSLCVWRCDRSWKAYVCVLWRAIHSFTRFDDDIILFSIHKLNRQNSPGSHTIYTQIIHAVDFNLNWIVRWWCLPCTMRPHTFDWCHSENIDVPNSICVHSGSNLITILLVAGCTSTYTHTHRPNQFSQFCILVNLTFFFVFVFQ